MRREVSRPARASGPLRSASASRPRRRRRRSWPSRCAVARARPATNPRWWLMMDAWLSPKKPARTEAAMSRTGPRPTGSTRPNSPASIDQSPPSVPANPNDRAWPASGVDKAVSSVNIGAMNRRTFVLLSGTASGSLLGSRAWSRGAGWIPRSADGRLVFSLDAQRRWTLSYHDAGDPRSARPRRRVGGRSGGGSGGYPWLTWKMSPYHGVRHQRVPSSWSEARRMASPWRRLSPTGPRGRRRPSP